MTGHREEIGRRLREARQSAGLSLAEISDAIRVRPVYLTAIEAGEFERLPGLPQTVGFTRAYARHLSVDIEGPLAQLCDEVHRHIDAADYSEPEPVWTVSPRRAGYVSAGALACIVLLGLAFIDFGSDETEPAPAAISPGYEMAAPAAREFSRPVSPYAGRAAEPPRGTGAAVTASFREAPKAPPAGGEEASSVDGIQAAATDAETPGAEAAAMRAAADIRFVKDDVYLRAGPANSGTATGVLERCEVVTYDTADQRAQWYRVNRADGSSGWVYRAYIAGEKPGGCP